jgi:predicted RNA binding protein YcfA (HicA-like mRNA interferase family)
MPKIYSIRSKEVVRVVKLLNYEFDHATGSHHVYKNLNTNKIIVIPMHNKDLRIGTVKAIIRQLDITQKYLLDNI